MVQTSDPYWGGIDEPGAVFTMLHFPHNLSIDPKSYSVLLD